MEMVGLVVLRGQDAAKRVHVGDEHEDALRRRHSQSEVGLHFEALPILVLFSFTSCHSLQQRRSTYPAGYLAPCLQPPAVFFLLLMILFFFSSSD